jgi:glycosyltransferase involved in cell wall biosynthesis
MIGVGTERSVLSFTKPRLLTFVSYYLPGYKAGGPPRSIKNLVQALAEDFEFLIVTRDRDLGDCEPYPVAHDTWSWAGDNGVNYRSPAAQSLRAVARLLRDTPHDVLYLNSVFDVAFMMRPLLARRLRLAPASPLVIAPRGELAPGALTFKRTLKTAYLASASRLGLFDGAFWMASSPHEARDIQRAIGIDPERIMIAPDLVGTPAHSQDPAARAWGDPLRIVFLGRISPMKNLDFALTLLRDMEVPITMDVYGPCADEAYLRDCRRLVEALPHHIRVNFAGEVEPERVHATLSRYDLMLLPTRGENFGHVILEALQAGTPVLISDRTRWHSTADGACLAIPLEEPEKFRNIIQQRARLNGQDQTQLRSAARLHAAHFSEDPDLIPANRNLFLRAVESARGSVR